QHRGLVRHVQQRLLAHAGVEASGAERESGGVAADDAHRVTQPDAARKPLHAGRAFGVQLDADHAAAAAGSQKARRTSQAGTDVKDAVGGRDPGAPRQCVHRAQAAVVVLVDGIEVVRRERVGAQSTFEEVVYLLWFGALPSKKEYDTFYKTLNSTATRRLPPKLIALLRTLPKKATTMEVLRTGVSALSAFDPDHDDQSREAEIRKAIRLTAQMPTLVAAWERLRRGKAPVAPDPRLNLSANFLYMMFGRKPSPLAVKTFDVALILHADHEFNASTFAARVTAATLSDMYSAITSAIGALKGPLHGGANEQVMLMVDKIKDPAK